jgi:hypothetical protein
MDEREQRAAERRSTWQAFVAHSAAEAAAYERAQYAAMTPEERVATVWELTLRMPWGEDAAEFRLDRSLGRVERRRR